VKPEDLHDLLARCSVRISSDGRHVGTGFFVAPGKVLTAAHVVAPSVLAHETLNITWQKTTHPVIHHVVLPEATTGSPYPYPDTALLTIELTEHPCVQLEESLPRLGKPPDSLWSYGYTAAFSPNTVAGTPVSFSYEGTLDEDHGPRIQLKQGQVQGGMSGSALLNDRTGRVCGIVTRSRETHRDAGGWAVPVAPAFAQLEGLKRAHDAHHVADPVWRISKQAHLRERGGRPVRDLLASEKRLLGGTGRSGSPSHEVVRHLSGTAESSPARVRQRLGESPDLVSGRQSGPLCTFVVPDCREGTGQ
jgi:hypothetical protein